jgi:hypothetical protein
MKKVLSFLSCALFVAAMTVSCGQKNAEEATDSIIDEATEQIEEAAAPVECTGMSEAEHAAMLSAAEQAGIAKCNCYKTDPSSVEACIKSILSESYAKYQENEEFQAAMNAAYQNCVKEKATAAAKEAANEGIKEGAKAISNALKK